MGWREAAAKGTGGQGMSWCQGTGEESIPSRSQWSAMLVAATEQVSKGLMSSLNWSERLARVMQVKSRGAEREKPNCSGLRREWAVREQKKV